MKGVIFALYWTIISVLFIAVALQW